MNSLLDSAKKYGLILLLILASQAILNTLYGSVCFSKILFGIPCPACGITRASKLAVTGHFRESWQMHPLLILVVLGFVLYPIIKKLLKNYFLFLKLYVIITIIIFVVYYIYRMKVYFPHTEPMVYFPDNLVLKYILPFLQ